jgi:hypothetical protein
MWFRSSKRDLDCAVVYDYIIETMMRASTVNKLSQAGLVHCDFAEVKYLIPGRWEGAGY